MIWELVKIIIQKTCKLLFWMILWLKPSNVYWWNLSYYPQ